MLLPRDDPLGQLAVFGFSGVSGTACGVAPDTHSRNSTRLCFPWRWPSSLAVCGVPRGVLCFPLRVVAAVMSVCSLACRKNTNQRLCVLRHGEGTHRRESANFVFLCFV